MKYFISTISDVDQDMDNPDKLIYVHHTGPAAKKYGLGLELAEFCISDNCVHPENVMTFFEENLRYSDINIMHAPYNELYPHAIDPDVAKVCNERFSFVYDLCLKYNIKKLVVHGNYVPYQYFPSWFIQKNIDFWKEFLDNHPGDTQIVLENVLEYEPSLLTEIAKGVNNDRFKICLDIGHANLQPKVSLIDWLNECAPYLSHLHIHNNDGKIVSDTPVFSDYHRGLGHGVIDYETLLRKADELVPDNLTATLETSEYQESIDWLIKKGFI